MNRADYGTLVSLGLSEADMSKMRLLEPATADPAGLMDAYLRRSNKKEDLATLRGHLRDLVRWADSNSMQIRHVWFEQLSASKTYVRRREFEKCTNAVLEGKSKTMGIWKTDRFDRRGMGAVGRVLDEFDSRRARLVSVTEGLDSSQTGARIVFAILSERAREEAKDIAKRVKIGHDSHKIEGRRGTGVPPFGLTSPREDNGKPSGKVAPHATEFAPARRIADLVLGIGGKTDDPAEPLSTVKTAHLVNEEGSRTRNGSLWTGSAVSKLVQSPLFAGMVPQRTRKTDEHGNPLGEWEGYGEPLLDEHGQPIMCGTGVVTVSEWYKTRALIRGRTSEEWAKGKPEAKYLGTGIYTCGRHRTKEEKKGAVEPCYGPLSHRGGRYRCEVRQTKGRAVCEGVVTLADRIDFTVGEAWRNHVAALDPGDPVLTTIGRRWLAFSDPETQAKKVHAQEALKSAEARVKKLEDDYYVYGKISEDRYEELSLAQRATMETMTATLEALDKSTDLTPLLNPDALREAWEDATIADRRMLLMCALGKKGVTLSPAARQGDRSPIIERLSFDWISND